MSSKRLLKIAGLLILRLGKSYARNKKKCLHRPLTQILPFFHEDLSFSSNQV